MSDDLPLRQDNKGEKPYLDSELALREVSVALLGLLQDAGLVLG
jgi:hypothetical protein